MGAGMVICLVRGADLHTAHTFSCFGKIQIGFTFLVPVVLPFWYRLTRVVPDKGSLNVCVCVCVCLYVFPVAGHSVQQIWTGFGVRPPYNLRMVMMCKDVTMPVHIFCFIHVKT